MFDLVEIKITEERKQVLQTYRYAEIKGQKYNLDVLYEILESLENTSYGFQAIVIDYSHENIEKLLESLDVISVSIRGSCSKSKNYDQFYKQICDIYWN